MSATKTKKPFKQRLWWKITAGILGVILLFFIFCWTLPRKKVMENNPMLKDGKASAPMLIAHGGGNKEFPDNTLEAFYNAYSIDKNAMMETDVSITKDGVVILSHDRTLSRKTDCNKAIIDVDYTSLLNDEIDFNYSNETTGSNGFWTDNVNPASLNKFKNYEGKEVKPTDVDYQPAIDDGILSAAAVSANGAPRHTEKFLVTSLEDLLRAFPNNYINVEIKQENETGLSCLKTVLELMQTLEDEGIPTFNRVVLASFHRVVFEKLLDYKKNEYKDIMYSPETKGVTKFFILQAVGLDIMFTEEVAVLQIPMKQSGIDLTKKSFIRRAHKHNIAVHYWTINEPDDMRLLCRNGADGIMTDRPSLLKAVLNELY